MNYGACKMRQIFPLTMETPLIKEHCAAGARLGEFATCVLPEGFSDFKTEYTAARETVAIFDTNWHAVMTLAAKDRVRYLNAIVTNNVQSLPDEHGLLSLLLNPQGHILAELEIYKQPDKLITISHASVRERTYATLDKFIIMDDVDLEDLTDQVGSMAIEGPRAAVIVQQACGLKLEDLPDMAIHDVNVERIPCHFIRRSHFGQPGAEFIARLDRLSSLWEKFLAAVRAHEGAPIGMMALNSLRLEVGIPWFPQDFNDTVIPQEAALEGTHISFTKGCYTGQEIVERVRSRGHVNRRRALLRFSPPEAVPPPATRLRAAGVEVGLVTGAAFSPAAGTAIGMGYVRSEHGTTGTALEFDGGTALVEAIP